MTETTDAILDEMAAMLPGPRCNLCSLIAEHPQVKDVVNRGRNERGLSFEIIAKGITSKWGTPITWGVVRKHVQEKHG